MTRHLLNFLTALSLLLGVSACALWVRSYSVLDSILWLRSFATDDGSVDLRSFAVATTRGGFGISRERHRYPAAFLRHDGFEPEAFRQRVLNKPHPWTLQRPYRYGYIGFQTASPYATSNMIRWVGPWPAFEAQWRKQPLQQFDVSEQRLAVPYWLAAGLMVALPVFRLGPRLWVRFRPKHVPGHCCRCGYDLRATPGRCPECGMPAAVSVTG